MTSGTFLLVLAGVLLIAGLVLLARDRESPTELAIGPISVKTGSAGIVVLVLAVAAGAVGAGRTLDEEGSDDREPDVTEPPAAEPLRVSGLSLRTASDSLSSACPTAMPIAGVIRTSGSLGEIAYRVVRREGPEAAPTVGETQRVEADPDQPVAIFDFFPVGDEAGTRGFSAVMEILEPDLVTSDPARFTVTCEADEPEVVIPEFPTDFQDRFGQQPSFDVDEIFDSLR